MPTAEIDGVPIHFTDSGGDGPAVLFSHGFLMDHTMFDAQVADLAADHRCIRWDERGFGRTPAPGPFTYWDSADDAVGLLDHLGLDGAVFVGMSQGGFLSLRAALAHPSRVRGVFVIDSAADVDPPEVLAGHQGMADALLASGPAEREPIYEAVAALIIGDPDLSAEWIARWRELDDATFTTAMATLVGRDDITDRLGEIACPVAGVHGSEDAAISLARAQALCAAVPDCRGITVVEGAAHAPNMTHPEIVNGALREFLAAL